MQLHTLLDQGVTVLTASRRLAYAVRLSHARYSQERGLQAWRTPRVLPWSTWLRQQFVDARASAMAMPTATRVLTRTQSRLVWDGVVGDSRLARHLLNPAHAARLAGRSWQRLHDYLIPLDRLQSFEAPEARALYSWCSEFERRCAALEAIDEARLSQWAHDSQLVATERIACAGFAHVPPAMSRLIERWRAHGKVVDLVSARSKRADIEIIAADDALAELELAARWAREQVLAGAASVGVVLPDLSARGNEARRVFEDEFAPGARHTLSPSLSIPVTIAAPAALSAFPMIDAALLMLQLAARDCTSTDAGRLLRSAFLSGSQAEAAQRALADRRLREEQRDRWNWLELERWASITGCMQLLLSARAVNAVVRSVTGTAAAASSWAKSFYQIWLAAGWPGDRTLSSAEHQTLEKLHNVLAEFGALDAVVGRLSMQQALSCLRDLLGDTPFEPESGAAVTVIDSATSAGMQFDALWVAGLDADRLPAPVNPDPLIPLELQREAGIPEATAAGVLQHAMAQLQGWTNSAARIVLSWPQREGDAQLTRSPLLNQVAAATDRTSPAARPAALRRIVFEQRPLLQTIRDDRAPPLSSRAAQGGARTIELQSRCPFRAQAEIRLRAECLPRVSPGVEPIDRGALLHRVLADVWSGLGTQQQLLALDSEVLEQRVRESAQRNAAQSLQADVRYRNRLAALEIVNAVRQVMQLLALDKQRPPFAIRLAEAAEQYLIGGLSITLRPDRIDELAAGGEMLIDYKLGSSHRPRGWIDAWPGRPRNPQLPLYGIAHGERLRALSYAVLSPGAVEYRGWSDGTDVGAGVVPYPAGIRPDLGDPMDWQALLHHWHFTLTRLAESYVAGEASVDPLPFECATCHLSTLCRINELALGDRDAELGTDD